MRFSPSYFLNIMNITILSEFMKRLRINKTNKSGIYFYQKNITKIGKMIYATNIPTNEIYFHHPFS